MKLLSIRPSWLLVIGLSTSGPLAASPVLLESFWLPSTRYAIATNCQNERVFDSGALISEGCSSSTISGYFELPARFVKPPDEFSYWLDYYYGSIVFEVFGLIPRTKMVGSIEWPWPGDIFSYNPTYPTSDYGFVLTSDDSLFWGRGSEGWTYLTASYGLDGPYYGKEVHIFGGPAPMTAIPEPNTLALLALGLGLAAITTNAVAAGSRGKRV